MGTVNGLVDLQAKQGTDILIERLVHPFARNQKAGIASLVRTEQRSPTLLKAANRESVPIKLLDTPALLGHPSPRVRDLARGLLDG